MTKQQRTVRIEQRSSSSRDRGEQSKPGSELLRLVWREVRPGNVSLPSRFTGPSARLLAATRSSGVDFQRQPLRTLAQGVAVR